MSGTFLRTRAQENVVRSVPGRGAGRLRGAVSAQAGDAQAPPPAHEQGPRLLRATGPQVHGSSHLRPAWPLQGEGGREEAEMGLLGSLWPPWPSHVDRRSKSEEQAFPPRPLVKPGFPKSFQYCQIHRDLTALLGLFVTTEAALSMCTCHTSVFAWPACLPCPFVRC